MGREKDTILNDRVKTRGAGTNKMSLQTGVVRKCIVRLQGRNVKYRVSCRDEGVSSGTGSRPKMFKKKNLHNKGRRQLNRGSSEIVRSKGCIIRKHCTVIDELSDRIKHSEQEEVLYNIMRSIPPAQINEKLFIHRRIKL